MLESDRQAFVPGFQYDVFISYAWVNNYPERDDQPESGWVSQIKTKLQQRIDERLGRTGDARLFFDRVQLGKNQDFNPQIKAAVQSSALFVAMFSDGYIQSPGCRDEIAHFNKAVGGDVARSGRLFLVHVDHVDPKTWPKEFQRYLENLIGYEFFVRDPVSLRPARAQTTHETYQSRLEELSSTLSEKLKQMREERRAKPESSSTGVAGVPKDEPQPTVLVAQSTADLRTQRKKLIKYCESAEVRVVGGAPYPLAADGFRESFLADLQHAHVFVQLLSDCYSDRIEDFPDGKELWQLSEARRVGIPTLQWRADSLDVTEIDDDRHRDLVCHPDVRTDLSAAFHTDVVDRARRAFEVGKAPAVSAEKRVALVKFCDTDQQPTLDMVETLKHANVICRSTRNGRPMVDRLREIPFDALIVVLGNCPEDWLEQRGDELLAVELNFKDQAPLRAYYFCSTGVMVPPFVGQDVLEIHGPDQLDRLVQAIQADGGPR